MKNKKGIFLILIFAVFVLTITYNAFLTKENKGKPFTKEIKEKQKIKIVDEDSKTRPYAIMINNNHAAWPHSGLNDAYIVYEIIAEGGITRLMAIFKDKDTAKIGSVRSARPYYIDYAMENDAIYVHYGQSDDARKDIKQLNVDEINGMTNPEAFFRVKNGKAYEHTAYTSMEKLKKFTKEKNIRQTTNKKLLLNYSPKEINLEKEENAKKANNILINYSYYTNTSYTYDENTKTYKRIMSNKPHMDENGQQYTAKNIIITPIKNYSYDTYGRQKLDDVGQGEGYYITDGYYIPIKWKKTSREAQTKYTYENGKEIKVNDGNTYIQITPIDQTVNITE